MFGMKWMGHVICSAESKVVLENRVNDLIAEQAVSALHRPVQPHRHLVTMEKIEVQVYKTVRLLPSETKKTPSQGISGQLLNFLRHFEESLFFLPGSLNFG